MPIEAVVFDIGRVLIEWEPERFYDSRIGAARRQQLFDQVPLHEMNLNVDRGHPFRGSVYALAEQHPDWSEEIRWWHDYWLQMVPREIPHSVRLMQMLQAKGTPVFALSNFGAETFETACAAYPFLQGFDRTFVSAHLETIKPEPEIYAILERETGVAPDRLLFTDDRPENIEAAKARGWQTHLFTAPAPFAARLVQAGLLTDQDAA
ncbi:MULTISPECIES: HAD family hydrolase [unclassified Leisingera]|uniref:HAD family hydrolase n=1 Tax=unclassified Leisingera TaxID=2614906 RepID=UPI0002EDFC49|nr:MULTISPECIES: HAD family phosphatase [unclassified Leisingera]KIC22776.1 haloacid dehalogenase [Leisingera sp. ANG-S3]KIC51730.1 haloacid dehalogenase [Leisingera sp. ANG-S]KID08907.1 haloacid dehalogenase [Leisingera sp. ANG1]